MRSANDPRAPRRAQKRQAIIQKPRYHQLEGPKPTKSAGPTQKKSLPAAAGSVLAVVVILFALGKFHFINHFGANLNSTLQANNDVIVTSLLHSLPAMCMAFGALLIAGLVWAQHTENRRSS